MSPEARVLKQLGFGYQYGRAIALALRRDLTEAEVRSALRSLERRQEVRSWVPKGGEANANKWQHRLYRLDHLAFPRVFPVQFLPPKEGE